MSIRLVCDYCGEPIEHKDDFTMYNAKVHHVECVEDICIFEYLEDEKYFRLSKSILDW